MMSRSGGSLIVPVILVVVITLLLYFHWGLRGQVARVHEEAEDLSGKLMVVQQERDEMAVQVRRYAEQINQGNREKKALEEQQRECHAKLDELQVNMKSLDARVTAAEDSQKAAEDSLASKEDDIERVTKELEDYKSKHDQCQSNLNDNQAYSDKHLADLQQRIANLQQDKSTLAARLSETGDNLQAVTGQLHQCQDKMNAGHADNWEGRVSEGGRPNIRQTNTPVNNRQTTRYQQNPQQPLDQQLRYNGQDQPLTQQQRYNGQDQPLTQQQRYNGQDQPLTQRQRYNGQDQPLNQQQRYNGQDQPLTQRQQYNGQDQPLNQQQRYNGQDQPLTQRQQYNGQDQPLTQRQRYNGQDQPLNQQQINRLPSQQQQQPSVDPQKSVTTDHPLDQLLQDEQQAHQQIKRDTAVPEYHRGNPDTLPNRQLGEVPQHQDDELERIDQLAAAAQAGEDVNKAVPADGNQEEDLMGDHQTNHDEDRDTEDKMAADEDKRDEDQARELANDGGDEQAVAAPLEQDSQKHNDNL